MQNHFLHFMVKEVLNVKNAAVNPLAAGTAPLLGEFAEAELCNSM